MRNLTVALTLVFAVATFASADVQVEQSLVVSGQGFFPVALRMQDGRIAVVLRGGAPHLGVGGRLDIVFSSDEGRIWTKPAVVVDSPFDDRNPALGQARNGTLVVGFWRTARYDDAGKYNEKLAKPVNTWVTRSTDAGRTWSEPVAIDVSDISWGSPYGRISTLADGAMLMNIYGGPDGDNSYIYRSDDNGKNWKRVSQPGANRFNETALLALPDGRWLAAMRSTGEQQVWLTASADQGKTWSGPRRITPAKVHPADLTLLNDGRILLTTGHRPGPFGVCAVVIGKDLTFDWNTHVTLTDDATNIDCGYPSTVSAKDGKALTVYYAIGSRRNPTWGTHCALLRYAVPGT